MTAEMEEGRRRLQILSANEKIHRCKFCGDWTEDDPSDQVRPVDGCSHYLDLDAAWGRLPQSSGVVMDGLYKDPHGYEKPEPIEAILRRQASQENCDGEPYDAMIYAAKYLDYLKGELQSEIERGLDWKRSSATMAGFYEHRGKLLEQEVAKNAQLAEEIGRWEDIAEAREAQLRTALDELADAERQLAEARQREEDAVSQHDTLRDQRDAEKSLGDQLHEVAYACVSWENPARAAYRKARGL